VSADSAEIDQALIAAARDLPAAKAAQQVAQRFGLPRKELYARLLALKAGSSAQ
jgi:16S rRNA (cytidine1402-2'-O)-methyltransferase